MASRYQKSERYQGVYYEDLKNGERAYHVVYKKDNKTKWKKIGNHSAGIREKYCYEMKIKLINEENVDIGKNLILNEVAYKYFSRDTKSSYKKTYGQYKKHFENWIGKNSLDKINKSIIIDIDNKNLEYATKNSLISILRAIYNFAIDHDLYNKKNPFSNLRRPKPKNERERFLSNEEVNSLLLVLKNNELLYLFVKLALKTGARLETICNIKKSDFLENRRLKLVDLKRDSTVYYGYYDNEIYNLAMKSEYDYVLQRTENSNYISHKIQRELQPILNSMFNSSKSTTKDKVVIHTLRHTFASHLAINKAPIYVIQKLMNHADIKMTLRYAKLAPDSGKDEIEKLFV